jgi:hypothetical protein
VHGRPGYRCRHGHTSSRPRPVDAPHNLYLREDHLLDRTATWLASHGRSIDPERLATFLRTQGLIIRCDRSALAVTDAPVELIGDRHLA